MTNLNNESTARELATSFGCSLPTVMIKAKTLGIKFKGRTVTEHAALMDALATVQPRPRKQTKKQSKRPLGDRIKEHFVQGKELIQLVEEEYDRVKTETVTLTETGIELKKTLEQLKTEQETFSTDSSEQCP
jgi:hypothetical protein